MSSTYLNFFLILLTSIFLQTTIFTPKVNSQENLSLSNSEIESNTALEQAISSYEQTKFSQTVFWLNKAYAQALEEKDVEQQIQVLNLLATTQQKLGQLSEAQSTIERSLNLINTQTQTDSQILFLWSQAFNIQGNILFKQGQIEKALFAWQNAQQKAEFIDDFAGVQGSLINQITAYSALGEYLQANKTIRLLESKIKQQSDRQIKVYSLLSLGIILQKQGQVKESETSLKEALQIAKNFLGKGEINQIKFSLAKTLTNLSKTEEAIALYEEIIKKSDNSDLLIKAKLNLLNIKINQEKVSQSNDLLNNVNQHLKTLKPSRNNLYAQINLVQSLFNLSALTGKSSQTQIIDILTNVLKQGEQIEDKHSLAYGYGMLGKLYLQQDRLAEAEQLTQKALLLAQGINAVDILVQWQGQMGHIYRQQGKIPEAVAIYQDAVDNLESLSQELYSNNSEVQFSFREGVEPIYRQLIDLLLSEAQPSQDNLQKAIAVFEKLHIAELKNFFGDGCLVTKSVDEIKDPTGAIIYPIILRDRLVVITSLPQEKFSYHSIDIPQAQLESTLVRVRNSLHPTASNRTRKNLTQQMYDWLIAPITDELEAQNISTLIFALDGMMRNLPMASLYDGQNYLIEKYAIALIPVRVDLFNPQPWQKEQLKVVIAGLSESRQGFTSLPAVEKEIQAIANQSANKILFNQGFTEDNLAQLVDTTSFPVLHLATHGQFSSKQEDTFLLTWNETINIKDLENLIKSRKSQEAIELLILSACQTAVGDQRAALGLAGLAMRSGAKSILATLWSVNDQSTAELMVHFYQQLQETGITKSEALRQAQLKLLRSEKYQHPYYWTAFVMVGNWF